MTSFRKHSHVKDLISYYAADIGKNNISQILMNGIKNSNDAEIMSKFISSMMDKMSDDCIAGPDQPQIGITTYRLPTRNIREYLIGNPAN